MTNQAQACREMIRRIDALLHDEKVDDAHKELHELAYEFEMMTVGRKAWLGQPAPVE